MSQRADRGEGCGARVVLLGVDCDASSAVYHALMARFADVAVVMESPVPRGQIIRGRLRRLGPVRVAGQLAFQVGISPWLQRRGRSRRVEILRAAELSTAPIPEERVRRVPSVNSAAARETLAALGPTVVVVSGTRIIGRATLRSVEAPFVNLHAGITPAYRGVHGAYWALADGHPDLAGVTVHFVDEGIDTGSIIAQARVTPTAADGFATYPALQLAAGVPLLVDAVEALLDGRDPVRAVIPATHEALRYHPTVWEYVWHRLRGRAR